MTIKYFREKHKPLAAAYVFLVDMNSLNECWQGDYTCYAPVGQHTPCTPEYLANKKKVKEIPKAEYYKASEGVYTPEIYLV